MSVLTRRGRLNDPTPSSSYQFLDTVQLLSIGALPNTLPIGPQRRLADNRNPRVCGGFCEADARTRTGDPFITSEVLYQLSYVGEAD